MVLCPANPRSSPGVPSLLVDDRLLDDTAPRRVKAYVGCANIALSLDPQARPRLWSTDDD